MNDQYYLYCLQKINNSSSPEDVKLICKQYLEDQGYNLNLENNQPI